MSRLYAQLARLYFVRDQACRWRSGQAAEDAWEAVAELGPAIAERLFAGAGDVALLPDEAAAVRVLAVDFNRPRDWPTVAALMQGLQDDLDLPAPALAVRAHAGYALWISLGQPLPLSDARAFLEALSERYLAELPPRAVTLLPGADQGGAHAALLPLLPARHAASGHWSAFIDPGLGALFSDEPWLEMAPVMNQQADILAALRSVEAPDLARAREALAAMQARPIDGSRDAGAEGAGAVSAAAAVAASAAAVSAEKRRNRSTLALGDGFEDPADFLLALMNDRSASARQRIAAAKALLPYFRRKQG